MPIEYGHGRKEHITGDPSLVVQYTKWFVLNNYEYVIHFAKGRFTIHAHNLSTNTMTKCEPGDTLEQAYLLAYTKLRTISTLEG